MDEVKKILIALMTVSMAFSIFFLPATATHASTNTATSLEGEGKIQEVDFSKPFKPKTEKELKKIRSSNIDYEVELTTEQAIARKAEVQNRPLEEVRAEFEAETKAEENTNSQFSTFAVAAAAPVCSWVEKRHTIAVKSHNASLIIMPQFCRSGSAGYVNTSKKPLLQEFAASSKSFNGTIAVDLRTTGYYYRVNGNFFNTTNVTHTGTVGISAVFTATYSVGGSSSLYGSITTPLRWVAVSR